MTPRTLFQKIWDRHLVQPETADVPAMLYIDLHLIHEVTSPQAFSVLTERGFTVRRPDRTVATMDHSTPTAPRGADGRFAFADAQAAHQVAMLEKNCARHGIDLYRLGHANQGIVHVIGPELGLTRPGSTVVCGDSHTSTHGAFGCLAFGIGTTEVAHVLATQCLLQRKPKTCAVHIQGKLGAGVTAKDLILHLIAKVGIGFGTGYVLEYRGPAIEALCMESRMTVCNMSIEAGARAGLIAPDEVTFAYLAGRDHVPKGAEWARAVAEWRELRTDPGATFDKMIEIDAAEIEPMITYGTNPEMAIPVGAVIPATGGNEQALAYMGFQRGQRVLGERVDVVFIGSCTNGRLSDLRQAAEVLRDQKIASWVRALVVPGSRRIKDQAELEGLDRIFARAGAEWREPGCSMCIAMNGDRLEPGQLAVSTSNRNFEGRQGTGGRTLLASPVTAAACAVAGHVCAPNGLGGQHAAV